MCFGTKADSDRQREIWLPQLPDVDEHVYHVIHPYGHSIACFVDDNAIYVFDMWVFVECPVNEYSWDKR